MTDRPAVDVVVPYAGRELDALRARLDVLRLRQGDTLTIALNRPSNIKGSDPFMLARRQQLDAGGGSAGLRSPDQATHSSSAG